VEIVEALGVPGQKLRGEAQRVARPDLAVVGDVGLQAEGRHRLRRAVRLAEPEVAKPRVGGEIEDHEVETHVHVPVVIDPLRADNGAVVVERGRDLGGVSGHGP
jgi:hypothetical protein